MTAQPLPEHVAFGQRYWLTDLLAVGGMAEIYLARQNAMAGFEKDVVIKRLKPDLARDRRIVQMFLDEARIGAVLNHPNIVHVYDVDEQDGVPYIAMEYIRGEELNILCRRGLKLGRFLPLEHAVELLRQAALGMGYFHARRDGEDEDLAIVHCDISPTNLLITEDGSLKVIDFGIARAANQHFRDESAIPGKLSYMSPEQALREGTLDQRSDIFSLGVVLYEIAVGKRLFKGPAHTVYKRLIECDIEPPTFVRNEFPGQLEGIIMRALERYPDDRYQSAYDLADDLEDYLREANLKSGPVRVARYLDSLTMAAGGERRPELISEAEQDRDEDDLDFDRGFFEGYQPAPEEADAEAEAWAEFEESDRDVAAALGIDPELIDHPTRASVPADVAAQVIAGLTMTAAKPAVSEAPLTLPETELEPESDEPESDEPESEPPAPDEPEPATEPEAPSRAAAEAMAMEMAKTKAAGSTAGAPAKLPPPPVVAARQSSELAELPWIPISAALAIALGVAIYLLLT